MDEGSALPSIELRDYLAVLRRRKWSILVVTMLILTFSLVFSFRQTPLYEGDARMLVRGVPTDSSGFVPPPNLETEAEIVTSEPVALRVIEKLDLALDPTALIDNAEVEQVAEMSHVLRLSYSSADPTMARDVPNALAEEYIAYKREQALEVLEVGVEAIENQIESVQQRLADVTEEIDERGNRGDALATTLESERSTLLARLGILQQRLDDYQGRRPTNLAGGEIIEPATLPASPTSPDHIRNGILGLLLGLGLGVAAAFLRERLDDRLRGREDLERALQVPVLATVPKFSASSKKAREIVTISQPRSSSSEAYRSLRTNLQFLSVQQELRSVLVTSASAGEGKTSTTINLAVAFAQAGKRVVLVSADLRRPTLESYFGLPNDEGLTTWLMAADRELWGLIRDPGIDNLRVISSGPIPPNPAELLASPRLTTFVELLEGNADLVLIDSPPVLAVADAAILSAHVDGTLLIVDAHSTSRSAASRAARELEQVGAPLLGTVFNSLDSSSTYYYQDYYSSTYASSPPTMGEDAKKESSRRSRMKLRK